MLQFFRNFFKSKFGVPFTLAFLLLIGIAFASSDVATNATFGGIAGGERVAVVGDEQVDSAQLRASLDNALQRARQTDPTLTMEAFLAQGGMDGVLDSLVNRVALSAFGQKYGFRVSDRLVDSELLQIGAFRGPDGSFDQATYEGTLRNANLTDSIFRQDLTQGLFVRQIALPATYGATMPRSMATRYATLLKEERKGAFVSISSDLYAPTGAPSGAALTKYYQDNRSDYIRPERRTIRYVTFGEEAVKNVPAVTEAQVAARYNRDKAQYTASEKRTFTQLVVPTQGQADDVAAKARGGASLASVAQGQGLRTTTFGPVTQSEASTQSSAAVAKAGFGAGDGAIVTARGPLGFYVLEVTNIDRKAGQTLAQARGAISEQLATENRRNAFLELAQNIEDEIDGGSNLVEIAKTLGLEVVTLEPATADGRIYGKEGTVPEFFARALPVAFELDEGDPQLAEAIPGESVMVFDVAQVTPSAVAPLAEIRETVIADWRRSEGSKGARAAADRIMKRQQQGQTLAQAVAAEGKNITIQSTTLDREALGAMSPVPPRVALFFSMAEGTTKKLEAENNGGWYVVRVDSISVPPLGSGAEDQALVDQVAAELSGAVEGEYSEQLVAAIEEDVGTERNQAAIDGVAASLTASASQ